jgi:hypothetical protein
MMKTLCHLQWTKSATRPARLRFCATAAAIATATPHRHVTRNMNRLAATYPGVPFPDLTQLYFCCMWFKRGHPERFSNLKDWLAPTAPRIPASSHWPVCPPAQAQLRRLRQTNTNIDTIINNTKASVSRGRSSDCRCLGGAIGANRTAKAAACESTASRHDARSPSHSRQSAHCARKSARHARIDARHCRIGAERAYSQSLKVKIRRCQRRKCFAATAIAQSL